jgi:ComF family protein
MPGGTKSQPPAKRWRPSLSSFHWLGLHAADAVLAVALAPECAACDEVLESPLAGPICPACWQAIRPRPSASANPTTLTAADYEGTLRAIIHAFKYEGRRSLAGPLGRLIQGVSRDLLREAACVVPVPLHPWKRLARGFNQAADLAACLGPPVVHALWRPRLGSAQAASPRDRRQLNVRRAFLPSPALGARCRRLFIEDRVVVLVDDVRTTGATARACADVLTRMGAREVRAVAVAQTPAAATVPRPPISTR